VADSPEDEQQLRAKIKALEFELVKQEKINSALKERVKRSLQMTGSSYSLFESNILLQGEIERQTHHLREAKELAEEANRAKTEFLSNVSHELRTPIHAILGLSTLGREDFENQEVDQIGEYFSSIHKSGRRLLTFVNGLLDIAKLESQDIEMHFKEVDLYSVVLGSIDDVDILRMDKDIEIEITEPKSRPKIIADKFYIEQLLQNLLSNAIKFTPASLKISLELFPSSIELGKEQIDAVCLSVSDQGVGIPHGELDKVFDKFIQSSRTDQGAGGTGLGLAICKQIVKQHRGVIRVENNPVNGVTFYVSFPVISES